MEGLLSIMLLVAPLSLLPLLFSKALEKLYLESLIGASWGLECRLNNLEALSQ